MIRSKHKDTCDIFISIHSSGSCCYSVSLTRLPVILLWLVTSRRHFPPHNRHSPGILSLFLGHFLQSQEVSECENPSRSAADEILWAAHLVQTLLIQSCWNPFPSSIWRSLSTSASRLRNVDTPKGTESTPRDWLLNTRAVWTSQLPMLPDEGASERHFACVSSIDRFWCWWVCGRLMTLPSWPPQPGSVSHAGPVVPHQPATVQLVFTPDIGRQLRDWLSERLCGSWSGWDTLSIKKKTKQTLHTERKT